MFTRTSVTKFGEISLLWLILKVFGHYLWIYLVFGEIFILVWQIFIVVKGQIWTDHLAIRSHWLSQVLIEQKAVVVIQYILLCLSKRPSLLRRNSQF